MKIGIITAMSSEFTHIAQLMNGSREHSTKLFKYVEGEIGDNTILLMQSGIGKVNSALGAQEMISIFAPDCILSSGVAGGIDSALQVMDIVVSRSCCYHDVWCGDGNERGQVQGLPMHFISEEQLRQHISNITPAEGSTIHSGVIISGDQFITNRTELDKIKSNHPEALAVDMESASIAQCCYLHATPFISVRIISDTPGATENHAEQYENFWGEIATRSFTTVERVLNSLPNCLK